MLDTTLGKQDQKEIDLLRWEYLNTTLRARRPLVGVAVLRQLELLVLKLLLVEVLDGLLPVKGRLTRGLVLVKGASIDDALLSEAHCKRLFLLGHILSLRHNTESWVKEAP